MKLFLDSAHMNLKKNESLASWASTSRYVNSGQ